MYSVDTYPCVETIPSIQIAEFMAIQCPTACNGKNPTGPCSCNVILMTLDGLDGSWRSVRT